MASRAMAGLLLVACFCLLPGSFGQTNATTNATRIANATTPKTIIAFARANNLTTLAAALEKINFTDPTANTTIFAPTNRAFEKLLADNKLNASQLLANKALGDILTYHVVPGKAIRSSAIPANITLPTANKAANLTVTKAKDAVKVDLANVTTADIVYNNFTIIHIVDGVLVPKGVTFASTTSGAGMISVGTSIVLSVLVAAAALLL